MNACRQFLTAAALVVWCAGCGGERKAQARSDTLSGSQDLKPACRQILADIAVGDSLQHPHLVLHNEQVSLKLYMPNHRYGYYRSSRFDWSGMIGYVSCKGHVFYTDWQTPHDPENPEHGIGPAEEFGMEEPLGYAQAGPGGQFLKIGVGILKRPEDSAAYFFNHAYAFATPPIWSLRCGEQWVEFTQDAALGQWAYHYVKRVSLHEATLTITHTLKNTGSVVISTRQYCHNFTNIDSTPVGPAYRVEFPFDPVIDSATLEKMGEYAKLDGNAIQFVKELGTSSVWANLNNLTGTPADNGATVINTATGAFVKIAGDRAPALYNFWATGTAACPEPFVPVNVAPGQQTDWTITLTFGTIEERGE